MIVDEILCGIWWNIREYSGILELRLVGKYIKMCQFHRPRYILWESFSKKINSTRNNWKVDAKLLDGFAATVLICCLFWFQDYCFRIHHPMKSLNKWFKFQPKLRQLRALLYLKVCETSLPMFWSSNITRLQFEFPVNCALSSWVSREVEELWCIFKVRAQQPPWCRWTLLQSSSSLSSSLK